MKNTIKSIFAAAALISTVSFNATADTNVKMIGANKVLPLEISVMEVATPEAVKPQSQRVYTPAEKAALVELDFTSQKQNTLKAADLFIDLIPAVEIITPSTVQTLAENVEYTPAQKASIVGLNF